MRILFLSTLGILGGAERVLLDLFAPLARALPGAKLALVSGSAGPLVERAAQLGVETEVVAMPRAMAGLGWSNAERPASLVGGASLAHLLTATGSAARELVAYRRALAGVVTRLAPDVVHSNGLKTHLLTALALPRSVPVVWHIHDFLGDRGALGRVLGAASRRAASAVANSRAVAEDARGILSCRPIDVVYNGVDVDVFAPRRAPARDASPSDDHVGTGLGRGQVEGNRGDEKEEEDEGALLDRLGGSPPAPRGTLRIGLVATYARWKGHELFLEAAQGLRARLPGAALRFYVVGGPVYLTAGSQTSEVELRARAAALGLGDAVVFVPFQDEPAAIYRALDVVVHASTRREPFGRTIVEAMACARPVVVADAGGAAELFTHDVDALGYAAGDRGALIAALAALAVDPALRRRLGEGARKSAVTRFSCERLGGEFASIYARLSRREHDREERPPGANRP